MRILLILSTLLLIIAAVVVNAATMYGPIVYVDYNKDYFVNTTKSAFDHKDNITFDCVDSLGKKYPYNVIENSPNTGYDAYYCDFNYISPTSGKGVDHREYIVNITVNNRFIRSSTYTYDLYYGYCPNVVCPVSEDCVNHECVQLCGNGVVDQGETCNSCSKDVKCGAGQYCLNNVCNSLCGNNQCDVGECNSCSKDCNLAQCQGNGQCNLEVGENCQNTLVDCACKNGGICDLSRGKENGCYVPFCGDDHVDAGETQQTCCKDAGCPEHKSCFQNKCVDCTTDSDCPGARCDRKSFTCVKCLENTDCGSDYCNKVTKTCVECFEDKQCSESTRWTSEFRCSPDSIKVMQVGYYIDGKCDIATSKCIGNKLETSKDYTDCTSHDKFCQSGKCDCDEGYDACPKAKKCVKISDSDVNGPCYCDFQCKSSYCGQSNTCIKPLNVVFSSNQLNLKVGDEETITLSVDNNLDKEVNVNMVIGIENEAEIDEILSGEHCSGNQCKISRKIVARGRNEITFTLKAKKSSNVKVNAEVVYIVDDKQYTVKDIKELVIHYTECGNKICELGESSNTCCTDCGCPTDTYYTFNVCNQRTKLCDTHTNPKSTLVTFFLFSLVLGILFIIYKYRWDILNEFDLNPNIKQKVIHGIEKESRSKKNPLIAGLLAFFTYPLGGGYIYLGKWYRFGASIIIIYTILALGGNWFFLIPIWVIWSIYDCVTLAQHKRGMHSKEKSENIPNKFIKKEKDLTHIFTDHPKEKYAKKLHDLSHIFKQDKPKRKNKKLKLGGKDDDRKSQDQ